MCTGNLFASAYKNFADTKHGNDNETRTFLSGRKWELKGAFDGSSKYTPRSMSPTHSHSHTHTHTILVYVLN